VIAFDADPLGPGPFQFRESLAWSARRRAFQAGDGGAALMASRADRACPPRLWADASARSPWVWASTSHRFAGRSGPALAATAMTPRLNLGRHQTRHAGDQRLRNSRGS